MADTINAPAMSTKDKATLKELRSFVRSRAKEAPIWMALDEAMDEAGEISRLTLARQSDLLILNDEVRGARDAVNAARATAARVTENARDTAEATIKDADRQHAKGEALIRDGEAIVTQARAEATKIIDAAKVEAARVTRLIDAIKGVSQ